LSKENLFPAEIKRKDFPVRLKRGQELIGPDGEVKAVRLQKGPAAKKLGAWNWNHNPFKGTQEFEGLRVMMALLSNWDLKDENNAIYVAKDSSSHAIYGGRDVGASFGPPGKSYSEASSKNNLKGYRSHKFIAKVTDSYVDFNFP